MHFVPTISMYAKGRHFVPIINFFELIFSFQMEQLKTVTLSTAKNGISYVPL